VKVYLFNDKYFHINTPFYSAWQKFGFMKDDWGLGLNKKRIDQLAKTNETAYVSYGKNPQLYTINTKKVKTYPVDTIGWSNTKLYVIPKSSLNYCDKTKQEIEEKDLVKLGVF